MKNLKSIVMLIICLFGISGVAEQEYVLLNRSDYHLLPRNAAGKRLVMPREEYEAAVLVIDAAAPVIHAGESDAVYVDLSRKRNDGYQTGIGYQVQRVYTNGGWRLLGDGIDDDIHVDLSEPVYPPYTIAHNTSLPPEDPGLNTGLMFARMGRGQATSTDCAFSTMLTTYYPDGYVDYDLHFKFRMYWGSDDPSSSGYEYHDSSAESTPLTERLGDDNYWAVVRLSRLDNTHADYTYNNSYDYRVTLHDAVDGYNVTDRGFNYLELFHGPIGGWIGTTPEGVHSSFFRYPVRSIRVYAAALSNDQVDWVIDHE